MINYEQLEELSPEDKKLYKKDPKAYWAKRREELRQEREQRERRWWPIRVICNVCYELFRSRKV